MDERTRRVGLNEALSRRVNERPGDARARERGLFLIVPGRDVPDLDRVVEHADGFDVIRKHEGDPERLADATDPRG